MLMVNLVRSQVKNVLGARSNLENRKEFFVSQATLLHADFFLGLFLTLKIEVKYSSETSVDFQRITGRYIPEGSTLHSFLIKKYLFK
jgi:hypothetical protein